MAWIPPSDYAYSLGRGKVLYRLDTATSWKDLMHVKEFKIQIATESVEHKSLRSSLVVKDRSVLVSMAATGSFICDVPEASIVSLWFLGTESAQSQSLVTLTAREFTVITPDEWQELQDSSITMKDMTVTAITDDTTPTPVALVEHIDYEADWTRGLFLPLSTSTHGISTAGDKFKITGTAAIKAWTKVLAGEESKKVHVWFCHDPATGKKADIRGYCVLKPNGDLSKLSENTWEEFQFNMEFEANDAYESNCGLEIDVLENV